MHKHTHISSATENHVPFGSKCLILIHRFYADKTLWSLIWYSQMFVDFGGFLIWTPKMHHQKHACFLVKYFSFCFYIHFVDISIWCFFLLRMKIRHWAWSIPLWNWQRQMLSMIFTIDKISGDFSQKPLQTIIWFL